jgi:hypothetical protein
LAAAACGGGACGGLFMQGAVREMRLRCHFSSSSKCSKTIYTGRHHFVSLTYGRGFRSQACAFAARQGHTATLYGDAIYVIGGHDGSAARSDVMKLTITTSTCAWSSISISSASVSFTARFAHGAILYKTAIYVFGGGTTSTNTIFKDVMKFEISTSTWTTVPVTGSIYTYDGRSFLTPILYNDYVYILAGSNDMLVFNIITSTFSIAIPYNGIFNSRYAYSATGIEKFNCMHHIRNFMVSHIN